MKPLFVALAATMTLAAPALAFDRETTNALKLCHDYLWDVPEFNGLPNAAISVFPASRDGNTVIVNWNVNWTDPDVRAAGNCTVIGGSVEGFEDYTKES
ncbi:hypothetical protein [Oceanomicrobium pacificus]|uniref:Uncharacterized protein n=1 Tax=Oceanomicrobium pacificus TaxID=2692916 RepID=A0A6B0TTS5_9RHOB|nr:hypothetical protein [Oceanomicrobium pacificus]MXU65058.1 hypothetical protein [Oceanomicrobium pacificus]